MPREHTGHSKHPLPTTQEKTLHMDITRWSIPNMVLGTKKTIQTENSQVKKLMVPVLLTPILRMTYEESFLAVQIA